MTEINNPYDGRVLDREIEKADDLERLVDLYVTYNAIWTPRHTLLAAKAVQNILAHQRMADMDQYYHDADYASGY